MNVRSFRASDEPKLRELFSRQGFEYEFPDLDKMLSCQIVVDDDDSPVMCVAARPTVELYLLCDSSWRTPGWRLEALKLMHEHMRRDLSSRGVLDAHIWLPPQVEKSFGRRLMNMFGWTKPLWTDYTRSTRG